MSMETAATSRFRELKPLLGAGGHSLTLLQARTRLIQVRVRLTAAILAVLMLAWVPVDIAFMPWNDIDNIALVRLISAAALVGIIFYGRRQLSQFGARILLALLLAIPMLFFFYVDGELQQAAWTEQTLFIKGAYSDLPILVAMLLSLFPLTAAEGLALGSGITAITLATALGQDAPAHMLLENGTLWIQLVVTGLAVISGMSQLHFMAGFVEYSTRDEMTGCLKRDYGLQLLETLFSLSERRKTPLCLLFIDLDHFKKVNDIFGHDAGDAVLKEAGLRLGSVLRHHDAIVRWGGEEFVALLPGATMHDIAPIFRRLETEGLGLLPDGRIQSASIGAAECLEDGVTTAQDLVKLADQRMYAAKQGGRNAVMLKGGSFHLVSAQKAA